MKQESEYEKQGREFLEKCNVTMEAIEAIPQTAPLWSKEDEKHGIQWSITLQRGDVNGKKIQFFFWTSVYALEEWQEKNRNSYAQHKHPKPSAYSVLSGLYSYVDSFEEFCGDYGYDEDSRLAFKTFKEVKKLNAKLESIFTSEELEAMREIQ